MTTRRVCARCGARVRSQHGKWHHHEAHAGTLAAWAADRDHQAVATWGQPTPPVRVEPPPPTKRAARKPQRPIAPIPTPVRWGPTLPWERRPFDPDQARERGCAAAAGVDVIGDI